MILSCSSCRSEYNKHTLQTHWQVFQTTLWFGSYWPNWLGELLGNVLGKVQTQGTCESGEFTLVFHSKTLCGVLRIVLDS